MTNAMATFRNDNDGVEARVFDLGARGFSVALYDVDSGETCELFSVFASLDAAKAHAATLAAEAA